MKITVIGLGRLGLVHAGILAEMGHEVLGIDPAPNRVEQLKRGELPFFEPHLKDLLDKQLSERKLDFSPSHTDFSKSAEAHFICVGTPQLENSQRADLTQIESAFENLLKVKSFDSLVIGKSTVPAGTFAKLFLQLRAAGFEATDTLVWNPEFLREGTAVSDSRSPDRVVIGSLSKSATKLLMEIYQSYVDEEVPFVVTDPATSELIKVSANAFLALKISFINGIHEYAKTIGADTNMIADALGLDARIGRAFLNHGLGYGGGCLPKDTRALMYEARSKKSNGLVDLLEAVENINNNARTRPIQIAEKTLGSLHGKNVGILGQAFKSGTDDYRESVGMLTAIELRRAGARVRVHDPMARPNFEAYGEGNIEVAETAEEIFVGADLVITCTDWPEYKKLDPKTLKLLVNSPVILDSKYCFDEATWASQSWKFLRF